MTCGPLLLCNLPLFYGPVILPPDAGHLLIIVLAEA